MHTILSSSQSSVNITDGVDGSPIEYIFSYNGSPIPLSTGSTPQCTSSSCQHTFRVTSSQVQQYTVSVAARNVVGMGTASAPVTVGMWCRCLLSYGSHTYYIIFVCDKAKLPCSGSFLHIRTLNLLLQLVNLSLK